jgi:DNA-binding transcriptional ArsR family regulator
MTRDGKPRALSVDQGAALFKLLGDRQRLRLLIHLARHGKANVSGLSRAVGQTPPAVSHHLKLLRLGGLVDYRREGKANRYEVTSATALQLLRLVRR